MQRPKIDNNNHLLTVEIPSDIYIKLLEMVKETGKTESELVIQGLQQVLGKFDRFDLNFDINKDAQDRLVDLEISLEKKLKQYVENLISDRFASKEFKEFRERSPNSALADNRANIKNNLPPPTIRSLQIGDRVLILEPDSAYYMEKLLVVHTSLLRATVATETGEMTFLKRDLRFVESTQ